MSELIVPEQYRCLAFMCRKPRKEQDFCDDHWPRIPSELKHEYLGAKREAAAKNYMTGRLKTAHENVIRVLAEQDRAEAIRLKKVIEEAERQKQDDYR